MRLSSIQTIPFVRLSSVPSASSRWFSVLGLAFWLGILGLAAQAQELDSDTLRLRLGVSADGIPIIKDATWKAKNVVAFADLGIPGGLATWVPPSLLPPGGGKLPQWTVADSEDFSVAEASVDLAQKTRLTWVVELAKQGSLIRLHTRLQNLGKMTQPISWFPVWSASWSSPDAALKARWWRALAYNRVEQPLAAGSTFTIGSRLQSSDVADDGSGETPYWAIIGQHGRTFFGLEWSGGWSATFGAAQGGFSFSAHLPPEETQLILGRRESIDGPALWVAPTAEPGDFFGRYVWFKQRQAMAQSLYGGPAPSFPLSYNTWYAARYAVDGGFVNRQLAARAPYGFDAFIVDAGWSTVIGVWKPDPAKFSKGQLENTLAGLRSQDLKAGLWSCPQFVSSQGDVLPQEADSPPLFSDFLDAYLSDLAGDGFAAAMPKHVGSLRRKYSVDWWKYDQPFFAPQSRAGVMRNVLEFQEGLRATREANSDLTIENCQSGGRMINELTLLATQTSWLRDGSATGLDHARENVQLTLGALDFMFPWAAYRFTNNFDRLDPADDELTRFYCRSAMLGVWGISSDLIRIAGSQQAVIVNEIANYRRLNLIKASCYYDLRPPVDGGETAGATFYDDKRQAAGVVLFRWDRTGPFAQQVVLSRLRPLGTYQITNADTGEVTQALGRDLMKTGFSVAFSDDRRSALLFVEQLN